jgi:histidinol-phosphatase
VGPDLVLALELADAADAISMRHFRTRLVVETKADLTPVTEADRGVETELRRLLSEARPDDAVLGEEHGLTSGTGTRRWLLDPIDGTRNFTRGIPVWGTLIALEEDGEVRVGVASAPALARRWWAERGGGAHANGDAIGVSRIERVEEAVLSFGLGRPLPRVAERAWHVRGFGDLWAHMLVAEGAVDAAVDELGVGEWDLAAAQVILEEAGGRLTDFAGERRLDSGSAVASNGLLHSQIIEALAEQSGA